MANIRLIHVFPEYDRGLHTLNYAQGKYQELVNLYNALGIDEPLTTEDLELLIEGVESMLFLKMTANVNQQIGSFSMDKRKMFELMEKPAGYTSFIEKVEEWRAEISVRIDPNDVNEGIRLSGYAHYRHFEITAGNVEIKQTSLDKLDSSYRKHTTSQTQDDEWQKINDLAEMLNEAANASGNRVFFDPGAYIKNVLQGYPGSYKPKLDYIKRIE